MIVALVAGSENRAESISEFLKKNKYADMARSTHELVSMTDGDIVSALGDIKLFGTPEVHIVYVGKEKSEIDRAVSILKDAPESSDTWIFVFEKLLKKEKDILVKKKIQIIESKSENEKPTDEVFSIVRAYERLTAQAGGGKKDVWLAYEKLVRSGIDPNQISGVLLWKLKQVGNAQHMRDLVTLVHESRTGGASIRIRLEHFLLSLV